MIAVTELNLALKARGKLALMFTCDGQSMNDCVRSYLRQNDPRNTTCIRWLMPVEILVKVDCIFLWQMQTSVGLVTLRSTQ